MAGIIPQVFGRGLDVLGKVISCQGLVHGFLASIKVGKITFIHPDGQKFVFGDENETKFLCTVSVHRTRFYERIALKESVGLGESYTDGDWDCDNVVALLCIMIENKKEGAEFQKNSLFYSVTQKLTFYLRWVQTNTPALSSANVQAHYDLGNDFYSLWLDSDYMAYTCALYLTPKDTLEQAQYNKINLIIKKLDLKSTDRVYEMGCGWGGFALQAAKQTGCKVVASNLSKEQIDYAKRAAKEKSLDHLVEFRCADYRAATIEKDGQFDKIVSIGMLEHVGVHDFPTFFQKAESLLKKDGILVTHCITYPDNGFQDYCNETDWTKIYIFPGSCIPSVTSLTVAAASTNFVMDHEENLCFNYALTCREWHARFEANKEKILKLGSYDDKFLRMWDFYLYWSEAAFVSKNLGLTQIIWKRPLLDAGHSIYKTFDQWYGH